MKLSQSLRRLQWRARRIIAKPVDNAPIVTIETEATAPPAPKRAARGWRFAVVRILWLALAFVVTLSVLAAVYFWFVAQESRVEVALEPPSAAESVGSAGSEALRAAIFTLEEAAAPANALVQQDMLLAPTSRRARLAALHDGAADAVARYLEALQTGGARREQALSDARFALAEGGAGRAAARAALIQLNDRAARGLFRPEAGRDGETSIVAAAANAAMIEADGLHAILGAAARAGEAERRFFRARGAALTWRRLLSGWVRDAPSPRQTADRSAAVGPALGALGEAATFQPTLILNAAPNSSFQPNHLAYLALLLTRSAWRLRAAQDAL